MLSFNKNTVRGARAARCDTSTENRAEIPSKMPSNYIAMNSAFDVNGQEFNGLWLVDDAEFMISGAQRKYL
jgi:hypothetical protein